MPFQKGNQFGKMHIGKKLSKAHRLKVSLTLKRKGIKPPSRKGIKDSIKSRKLKSEAQKLKIKNGNHNFWKGGKTDKAKIFRKSIEYRLWREAVFARDNWTCQKCGARCCELHPHHIKPLSIYPELGLAIDNGMTLCVDCHRETDSYAGKGLKRGHYRGKHIDKDPQGWSVSGRGGPEKPFDSEAIDYKDNKFFQEVKI